MDNSVSDQGVQFICSFEGFSPKPYPDPASGAEPITIGYGTTVYPNGTKVTMSDGAVTEDEGQSFIKDFVNKHATGWLNQNLPNLSQNQFDALCSFIYNLGLGSLQQSTLLKDINAGADNDKITADFNMWVNAGGHKMPGLVTRRAAEANLYCNNVYSKN